MCSTSTDCDCHLVVADMTMPIPPVSKMPCSEEMLSLLPKLSCAKGSWRPSKMQKQVPFYHQMLANWQWGSRLLQQRGVYNGWDSLWCTYPGTLFSWTMTGNVALSDFLKLSGLAFPVLYVWIAWRRWPLKFKEAYWRGYLLLYDVNLVRRSWFYVWALHTMQVMVQTACSVTFASRKKSRRPCEHKTVCSMQSRYMHARHAITRSYLIAFRLTSL